MTLRARLQELRISKASRRRTSWRRRAETHLVRRLPRAHRDCCVPALVLFALCTPRELPRQAAQRVHLAESFVEEGSCAKRKSGTGSMVECARRLKRSSSSSEYGSVVAEEGEERRSEEAETKRAGELLKPVRLVRSHAPPRARSPQPVRPLCPSDRAIEPDAGR